MNWENMVKGEASIIMLFRDLNLPYHVCINEIEGGGGASIRRPEPDGVSFGVCLCLNRGGFEVWRY